MSDFQRHLEVELKDPKFKEEWDKLEFRYSVIKFFLGLKIKITHIFK